MRNLPVFASFGEVYAGVFSHFFQLLSIAWLPLLIWILVSAVGNWWMLESMPASDPELLKAMLEGRLTPEEFETVQTGQPNFPFTFYALMFVEYFFLSIAAVGFHRFVLLGEGGRGWGGSGFVVGRAELLYVWSIIKIGLMYLLLNFLLMLAGILIVVVVVGPDNLQGSVGDSMSSLFIGVMVAMGGSFLLLLPLMARSALVLPHVALGNRSEMREVWRRTKGNGLRLAGYFLLVVLVAVIASWLFLLPVYAFLGIDPFPSLDQISALRGNPIMVFVQYAVGIPFLLAWTMLTITMLSVAYREIIGLPGNEKDESAPAPAQDTPSPA